MKVLEIKQYGDFDILQTTSIWIHDLNNPPYPEVDYENIQYPDDSFFKELKLLGWKNCKTKSLTFGGNF